MTTQQAREMAAALIRAAEQAEANGQAEINLISSLQAADDVARAELLSAISEAAGK